MMAMTLRNNLYLKHTANHFVLAFPGLCTLGGFGGLEAKRGLRPHWQTRANWLHVGEEGFLLTLFILKIYGYVWVQLLLIVRSQFQSHSDSGSVVHAIDMLCSPPYPPALPITTPPSVLNGKRGCRVKLWAVVNLVSHLLHSVRHPQFTIHQT